MNIDTSLLREKFVIKENNTDQNKHSLEIRAPSTRMAIDLQTGGLSAETFIIRTHNMHSCARMVSKIIQSYEEDGPLMNRAVPLNWGDLWHNALSVYERTYNHSRWVAVYHNGKVAFSSGEYHPFFDVIEKCDVVNKGDYEKSMNLAEDVFRQAGKDMTIRYDSNVALVAIVNQNEGRCSMVLRGPNKTTTFNYSIEPLEQNDALNVPQCLCTTADFLEGVQLSFMIGLDLEKLNQGFYEPHSYEDKRTKAARKRVAILDVLISSMENRHKVRYRPERPNFNILILDTEKHAKSFVLKDEEETYID